MRSWGRMVNKHEKTWLTTKDREKDKEKRGEVGGTSSGINAYMYKVVSRYETLRLGLAIDEPKEAR